MRGPPIKLKPRGCKPLHLHLHLPPRETGAAFAPRTLCPCLSPRQPTLPLRAGKKPGMRGETRPLIRNSGLSWWRSIVPGDIVPADYVQQVLPTGATMKCPHCGIHFHDNWQEGIFIRDNTGLSGVSNDLQKRSYVWAYRSAACPGPACNGVVIQIRTQWPNGTRRSDWVRMYPRGANRGPVPKEVPNEIAQDYVEACNVLPVSAKASAALSRRCLQHMLRSHGYKAKDLANEIDLLLKETDPLKALPMRLRETIDSIRNFGNFAAHPNENKATLENHRRRAA